MEALWNSKDFLKFFKGGEIGTLNKLVFFSVFEWMDLWDIKSLIKFTCIRMEGDFCFLNRREILAGNEPC